jgi:hypothetical protein
VLVALDQVANVFPRVWNVIRIGANERKPWGTVAHQIADVFKDAVSAAPTLTIGGFAKEIHHVATTGAPRMADVPGVKTIGEYAATKVESKAGKFATAMLVDTVTDPLTWIELGAGLAARLGAKGVEKMGEKVALNTVRKLTQQAAQAGVAKRVMGDLGQEALEEAVGRASKEAARHFAGARPGVGRPSLTTPGQLPSPPIPRTPATFAELAKHGPPQVLSETEHLARLGAAGHAGSILREAGVPSRFARTIGKDIVREVAGELPYSAFHAGISWPWGRNVLAAVRISPKTAGKLINLPGVKQLIELKQLDQLVSAILPRKGMAAQGAREVSNVHAALRAGRAAAAAETAGMYGGLDPWTRYTVAWSEGMHPEAARKMLLELEHAGGINKGQAARGMKARPRILHDSRQTAKMEHAAGIEYPEIEDYMHHLVLGQGGEEGGKIGLVGTTAGPQTAAFEKGRTYEDVLSLIMDGKQPDIDAAAVTFARKLMGVRRIYRKQLEEVAMRFSRPAGRAPEGWVKFPLDEVPELGELYPKLADRMMEPAVANSMRKSLTVFDVADDELGALGNTFNQAMHYWRSMATVVRPGWHWLNLLGNKLNRVINGEAPSQMAVNDFLALAVAGRGPRSLQQELRIWSPALGRHLTVPEVRAQLEGMGVRVGWGTTALQKPGVTMITEGKEVSPGVLLAGELGLQPREGQLRTIGEIVAKHRPTTTKPAQLNELALADQMDAVQRAMPPGRRHRYEQLLFDEAAQMPGGAVPSPGPSRAGWGDPSAPQTPRAIAQQPLGRTAQTSDDLLQQTLREIEANGGAVQARVPVTAQALSEVMERQAAARVAGGAAGAYQRVQGKVQRTPILNLLSLEGPYVRKASAKLAEGLEEHDKIAHYLAWIRKGETPEEAAHLTRRGLFDYGDLTDAERKIRTYLMPFYTWRRKNIALQLTQFLEHPGRMNAVFKARRAWHETIPPEEQMPPELFNPWEQQGFTVQTPWKNADGTNYLAVFNLPITDAIEATRMETWIHSLTPTKVYAELALGRDFFTNRELISGDLAPMPNWVTMAPEPVRKMFALQPMVNPYNEDEMIVGVPVKMLQVIKSLNPALSSMYYSTKSRAGEEPLETVSFGMARLMTGVTLRATSREQREEWFERGMAKSLNTQVRQARQRGEIPYETPR